MHTRNAGQTRKLEIHDRTGAAGFLDDGTFARICRALGHPARVKIIRHLLAVDNCICGRIVEILPLAQSTVSQHLKILKESGLVEGTVDGNRSCYCVNRELFAAFQKTIEDFTESDQDDGKQ